MIKPVLKRYLLKANFFITFLIVLVNITAFIFTGGDKSSYITFCLYANGFLFFLYFCLFNSITKKHLLDIKKEALYINYPVNIATFLFLLFLIIVVSAICLFVVNKEAANATFIFTFFMSTISMLFPSIILVTVIFFIVPAFIVPSIEVNKKSKSDFSFYILIILFIIYVVFCIYKFTMDGLLSSKQDKYKSAKLTIGYNTEFLKLKDVSAYGKKKLSRNEVKIPFFYTKNIFPYDNFEDAKRFCSSIDARIPNYLETYHLVFNRFDTFGERYYWTSDKDGKTPLVLHFKNMSFEITKKPENITPFVYCVQDIDSDRIYENKVYFYKNRAFEPVEKMKAPPIRDFELTKLERPQKYEYNPPEQKKQPVINEEIKHVNFSVKEVPYEYFNELLAAGYYYDPGISIKQEFETNDFLFAAKIQREGNHIRLCYFPFTDYSEMDMNGEMQIWKQSFCSPAFDLVEYQPVLKTSYEKDAYCYSRGARLPNVPELAGILKTLGINDIGVEYWTNNKITANVSSDELYVTAFYNDSRFMKVRTPDPDERAYTFCVKKPQIPSSVIANYKSRFPGVDGRYYAKLKCPNCHYYELPDTVLQR